MCAFPSHGALAASHTDSSHMLKLVPPSRPPAHLLHLILRGPFSRQILTSRTHDRACRRRNERAGKARSCSSCTIYGPIRRRQARSVDHVDAQASTWAPSARAPAAADGRFRSRRRHAGVGQTPAGGGSRFVRPSAVSEHRAMAAAAVLPRRATMSRMAHLRRPAERQRTSRPPSGGRGGARGGSGPTWPGRDVSCGTRRARRYLAGLERQRWRLSVTVRRGAS